MIGGASGLREAQNENFVFKNLGSRIVFPDKFSI